MYAERLKPSLDLLREEYVLVQAWKKTVHVIRYQNWFSDTLALDRSAVNLPTFIGEIRERLQSSETWDNDPLRVVLAPKSQHWKVRDGQWKPECEGKKPASFNLRPLAHVSLADQVVATALMLCLADRVETLQGDPRQQLKCLESRQKMVSYGHRLLCYKTENGELRHRWGSRKLYRAYFQDYRTFLSRPRVMAALVPERPENRTFVVHADLSQFYDRVRPDVLSLAINQIQNKGDDPGFFSLVSSVLNWKWYTRDERDVRIYLEQTGVEGFERVALPQGLVASGFFANIVLHSFDKALCALIGTEIALGIMLEDYCRYVDDFRILASVAPNRDYSSKCVQETISTWLGGILEETATGLVLSDTKTKIVELGSSQRPLVRQSAKMNRIQSAVSGEFDARGGDEILNAIQGLMRAQEGLSIEENSGWRFSPVLDVRDGTVARFGAARFRTTFRSIRPLLQEGREQEGSVAGGDQRRAKKEKLRVVRTRRELDEEARVFALSMIQRWINDPSNVRLLRIGLDLWPDAELLREILNLLRPYTQRGGPRKGPRRVAWYCLSEVLRAGATETGLVPDDEALPASIELKLYREELSKEAARLVALAADAIPWYLRQQALLFLAAFAPEKAPIQRRGRSPETQHYRELILFLRGEGNHLNLRNSEFAILAVLARRTFLNQARALALTRPSLNPERKQQIAKLAPSFLLELIGTKTDSVPLDDLPAWVQEDLCQTMENSDDDRETLAEAILRTHPGSSLRNELSILRFARAFLEKWENQDPQPYVITPGQVRMNITDDYTLADVKNLEIRKSFANASHSMYAVPSWCKDSERWRIQLGYLLRFILSGHPDFTRRIHQPSWKESEPVYRPAGSHWYQRLYGLYSGQPAFGDDWLPITDWMEEFLLALLQWPGCSSPEMFNWVKEGIKAAKTQIGNRIAFLEKHRGLATHTLILPMLIKPPTLEDRPRSLRACVVQTVVPTASDFCKSDLGLNEISTRRKHRNHLSAALAAVKRMLVLRETHKNNQGRLDWLILPELAVHPNDVQTHLVPFARAHKTLILTGLTYDEGVSGEPLINSALWVIPEWSSSHGLQVRTRRQGKKHLAPVERGLNCNGPVLMGFRPCQWLIEFPWSDDNGDCPVRLTAAICYDATDLALAADLRDKSDILAIPALNKDVTTFDQLALALHYHMFQLVIIANNGEYGGSNAYWPRRDTHNKQIFHIHGQPQASVTFLEINNIGRFLKRRNNPDVWPDRWKHPPAGLDIA